jgi:hypothetical protein
VSSWTKENLTHCTRDAREILKNDPSVPVAMYTLHQNIQLEAYARKYGVRKVISKTEVFTSLKASLEEMMAPAAVGPLQVPEDVSIPPDLPIDPAETKKNRRRTNMTDLADSSWEYRRCGSSAFVPRRARSCVPASNAACRNLKTA